MINITWSISNLERETSDGFVFTAHYTVNATDGTYGAMSYSSVGFERPDNLIPFEELTEELVVEWVKERLGEDSVTGLEQSLINQIEEQAQPTKISGVPWG